MEKKYFRWRSLFLFCLGLFLASAFCMKWIESSFIHNGKLFTILGLELTYSKEQIISILSGIDTPIKSLLRYQLIFDFIFMLGVYPGIAALNRMAAFKVQSIRLKKFLLLMAFLQLIAWGCDISENLFLLNWLKKPDAINHLSTYHLIVIVKWGIALLGIITGLFFIFRKNTNMSKS